jgi:hypothetical protein
VYLRLSHRDREAFDVLEVDPMYRKFFERGIPCLAKWKPQCRVPPLLPTRHFVTTRANATDEALSKLARLGFDIQDGANDTFEHVPVALWPPFWKA